VSHSCTAESNAAFTLAQIKYKSR